MILFLDLTFLSFRKLIFFLLFKGYLVYADPPQACKPVSLPPNEPNISKPWILLIARGECSYEVKVRNAQASHYSAVIVHNVNSSDLGRNYMIKNILWCCV